MALVTPNTSLGEINNVSAFTLSGGITAHPAGERPQGSGATIHGWCLSGMHIVPPFPSVL
jgi:hypothetical protein